MTRALSHRAFLDSNRKLSVFSEKLEKICISILNSGQMTKDLALMCGPDQSWVTTNELFKIIKSKI